MGRGQGRWRRRVSCRQVKHATAWCAADVRSLEQASTAQSASGMQRAPRNAVRLTIMSLVSASMAEARNRFSAVVPARSTVPLWHTVGGVDGKRGASGQPVPHYRGQGSAQRAQLQACQPSTIHLVSPYSCRLTCGHQAGVRAQQAAGRQNLGLRLHSWQAKEAAGWPKHVCAEAAEHTSAASNS